MSAYDVASFLSAIEELNQRYPPLPQNQVKDYAFPQVPASQLAAESTPNFSVRDVASPSIQQADTQQLRVSPFITKENEVHWHPRPLSAVEIEFELSRTRWFVANIQELYRTIQRFGKQSDKGKDAASQVRLLYITYRRYFGRVFRINDLPLEILVSIFRLIADPITHSNLDIQRRNAITSVCRHWRSVALDDGTLWGILRFSKPVAYEQCFEYFKRAKSSPLTVHVSDTPEEALTVETARSLTERLFTKLPCIRVFRAIVQQPDTALYFMRSLSCIGEQGIPTIMERLEIIQKTVRPAAQANLNHQPVVLFGGAYLPSLRHLGVGGLPVNFETCVLKDLDTLELSWMFVGDSPAVFQSVLRKSPNLSKLSLDNAGPRSPPSCRGPAPVSLPRLETLAIVNYGLEYTLFILSQFTAPNVVELNLCQIHTREPSRIFDQLVGKFPAVKSLTLNCFAQVVRLEDGPSIAQWLRTMPLLVYLRLVNVSENFLLPFLYDAKTLRLPTSNVPLNIKHSICPKLKYLEIHYSSPMKMPTTPNIPNWFLHRLTLGFPLWKCFIDSDTLDTLGPDKLNSLKEALGKTRTSLYRLTPSDRPIEEQHLLGRG
ncbi:hypothetical protein CVT26_000072 [Gymnopilus dilepis]|uniref:F-box domain-containing protein n=1 Tax=Gymnopilus dilepis TaxID=231916 RepID=A0A409VGH0_9AGAR|nr:hypothetical protein CVT26_000072 [Gymnopilus dilepis]